VPRPQILSEPIYSEQLDAIMRTESTFSFGALELADALAPLGVDVAVLVLPLIEDLSMVPVTSTL